jgi:hypothetical protein
MFLKLAATVVVTLPLLAQQVSLHVFAKGGKYGFMDDDGVVRIPARFDKALDFAEGMAPAARFEGTEVYKGGKMGPDCRIKALRWGYIGPTGEEIIQFRYSATRPFSEGRAAVWSGTKWGFIDNRGGSVVSPQFQEVGDFHYGMAGVQSENNGPYGYIDKEGKLAVKPQFWNAGDFQDGVAIVQISSTGNELLVDRKGGVLAQKGSLQLLREGVVAYGDSYRGPFGLMNAAGEIMTPAVFDSVKPFSGSIAAAKKAGRWIFIDPSGSTVAPIDSVVSKGVIGEMSEGLASVDMGQGFGFVDRTGKVAISARFSSVSQFSQGLAAACIGTGEPPESRYDEPDYRCGFIDRTGSFVISPRFRYVLGSAQGFEGGWAFVSDPLFNNRLAINRKGRIVLRPNRDDESHFEPFGNCTLPPSAPAGPPPPNYAASVDIDSIPGGASVYLVPVWDWQKHNDGRQLVDDPDALATYLVTKGPTPVRDVRLKAQVYMGVFELQGKRKIARVVVAADGSRQINVSF